MKKETTYKIAMRTKPKYLTLQQIINKSKKYKYAKLLYSSGFEVLVNKRILSIGMRYHKIPGELETRVVRVEEASFHEYISNKAPFF